MKIFAIKYFIYLLVVIITILCYHTLCTDESSLKKRETSDENGLPVVQDRNEIIIAVVACGDRLQEALTMIKSAIMFSKMGLHFVVVSENALKESFKEKLNEWRSITNNKFTFEVLPLSFPSENRAQWQYLFKPCASQRLFLPSVLHDIDSILYVDSDILFLGPVEEIWSYFKRMNSSQMAAVAPEDEFPNLSWYNSSARIPFYGQQGVNTGVMLMNLTRMRNFLWEQYIIPVYTRYKSKIVYGDQDLVNIAFYYHPDKLYIFSCRYNFRSDLCEFGSVCKDAEQEGVAILHGSRGIFHSRDQPAFQYIYTVFEYFQLGGDINEELYQPLQIFLNFTTRTNCGQLKNAFLMTIKNYIDNLIS